MIESNSQRLERPKAVGFSGGESRLVVQALPHGGGIDAKGFHSPAWIYRQRPLAKTTTLLLEGRWAKNQPAEPVAWTNVYRGGRVFYTTLGHPGDFKIPAFNRLLVNAIRWSLGRKVPGKARPAESSTVAPGAS